LRPTRTKTLEERQQFSALNRSHLWRGWRRWFHHVWRFRRLDSRQRLGEFRSVEATSLRRSLSLRLLWPDKSSTKTLWLRPNVVLIRSGSGRNRHLRHRLAADGLLEAGYASGVLQELCKPIHFHYSLEQERQDGAADCADACSDWTEHAPKGSSSCCSSEGLLKTAGLWRNGASRDR